MEKEILEAKERWQKAKDRTARSKKELFKVLKVLAFVSFIFICIVLSVYFENRNTIQVGNEIVNTRDFQEVVEKSKELSEIDWIVGVIEEVNAVRVEFGALEVSPHDSLLISAQNKADFLVEVNKFEHFPDRRRIITWMKEAGYVAEMAGENLARSVGSPKETVDAWFMSPGHKDVMLEEEYKDIGVGVASYEVGDYLIVLHMGDEY